MSIIMRAICFSFCCKSSAWFKRRIAKLERHEGATKKLYEEMDIVKVLHESRISRLISKFVLKKHQRALVTNFKSYQLESLEKSPAAVEPALLLATSI